jgi:ComEC/Rec2-related protein
MLIFLALTSVMTVLFSHRVPDILAIFTMPLQQFCINHVPSSPHHDLMAALVCGERLPSSDLKFDFVRTALLHLVVASGSHLALIETAVRIMCRKSRRSEGVVALSLSSYALFAGLCPPFLRVLLTWGLQNFCSGFKLGWSRLQTLTMGGFLTLLFCNRAEDLLSLALSWIAGLAVHILSNRNSELNRSRRDDESKLARHLMFHSLMYCLMIPALLPLSVPHPLSIAWNLFLGPLLTALLFPLAALSFFLPPIAVALVDSLFDQALNLVALAARLTPGGLTKTQLSLTWVWIYLFALLLSAHVLEARTRINQRDLCE